MRFIFRRQQGCAFERMRGRSFGVAHFLIFCALPSRRQNCLELWVKTLVSNPHVGSSCSLLVRLPGMRHSTSVPRSFLAGSFSWASRESTREERLPIRTCQLAQLAQLQAQPGKYMFTLQVHAASLQVGFITGEDLRDLRRY